MLSLTNEPQMDLIDRKLAGTSTARVILAERNYPVHDKEFLAMKYAL